MNLKKLKICVYVENCMHTFIATYLDCWNMGVEVDMGIYVCSPRAWTAETRRLSEASLDYTTRLCLKWQRNLNTYWGEEGNMHFGRHEVNLKRVVIVRFCGSLNDNFFHKLICLDTWSSVGRTVWEGLGGVVLLKKLCHWRWALRFQNSLPFRAHSPPSACGSRSELSAAAAAVPLLCHVGLLTLWNHISCSALSFISCLGSGV